MILFQKKNIFEKHKKNKIVTYYQKKSSDNEKKFKIYCLLMNYLTN